MNAADNRQDDQTFLDPFIDAARGQFSQSAVSDSATRLRSRLPEPVSRRKRSGALKLAGAALVVVAAVALGPHLLPGSNGSAFAQVQEWFSSYRTLHVRTVMEQGGNAVVSMDIWADDSGATRIEMDEVTHIIDPRAESMHTLLPDRRIMTQHITPDSNADVAMDWLNEIRDFQGQAERLPRTRMIDGMAASGYRLDVDGSTFTLWAETGSNMPLLVEMELPGGMTMRNTMGFDVPLPPDVFAVPEGYQPIQPGSEGGEE